MKEKDKELLMRFMNLVLKYMLVAWEDIDKINNSEKLTQEDKDLIKQAYQGEILNLLGDINKND